MSAKISIFAAIICRRVNGVQASPAAVRPGNAVSISWDVVCTDPSCKVTPIGGTVGRLIPSNQYHDGDHARLRDDQFGARDRQGHPKKSHTQLPWLSLSSGFR